MKILYKHDELQIAALLLAGKIGVVRTDTVYGIIGLARNQAVVERIYSAKGRDAHKSPIVLVEGQSQLFDTPNKAAQLLINDVWPGRVSVILDSANAPDWITRGNNSVAYRNPDHTWLTGLLARTGPLVAPSANLQGLPVARTIDEAAAYFGESVDFYVDGGTVTDNTPSRLVRIHADGLIQQLR